MVNLYTGTPGSGKSLHIARYIYDELVYRKKPVIANFPLNMALVTKNGKRKTGEFTYLPNHEITVEYLTAYAFKNHKAGIEGQTLLVIDEAGIMFNSRDTKMFDRKAWVNFFMTHRHLGFNVVLIAQYDRMLDRQIRAFVEYEVKHRKANNFRILGFILTLMRIPTFVAVTCWYGMRERCGAKLFRYRKRDSKLYDTMMLFGGKSHGGKIGETQAAATSAGGDTEACGGGDPPADEPPPSAPTDEPPEAEVQQPAS